MKIRFISIILTLAFVAGISVTSRVSAQGKFGATPEDSVECIMNLSLYSEFYKQWKSSGYKNASVNDAIGPWRKVFFGCPAARLGTYVDGVRMIKHYIRMQKDADAKDAYIDTLMMLYDARIENFAKEGYVLGRKGVDLYQLRVKDYAEAYRILTRSVELEGEESYRD